jgi:hypothetical protein
MSIIQNALKKHAQLSPGEYPFTIDTNSAVIVQRGALTKVGFDLHVGPKIVHVEIAYDGSPSGVVAQQLGLLDKWGKLVRADLSEKRIANDWRRVPYALERGATENNMVVFGTFTQTQGKAGGTFINLADVRVEEAVVEEDGAYEDADAFEGEDDAV